MLGRLGSCEDREKRTVCSNPPETFKTKAMACSSLKIVGLVKGQGKSEDTALDFQTPPPDWKTSFGRKKEDMKSLAVVPSILLRTVKTQSVILDILIERKAYIDFSRKQYVYTSV